MIEADEVWEVNGDVWYRQGKVIHYISRTDVVRVIRKPAAAPATGGEGKTPAKPKPNSSVLNFPAENSGVTGETPNAPANAAKAEEQKISRILLKGGVKIDADAVWEEPTRVGYRLGKMQTFVDREVVEKIIYEVVEEPAAPERINPQLRFSTGHRGLDQLIVQNAKRHNVDPLLIFLVMRQESGFNYRAVSRVGARGLMQLMPGTAARLGVRNIHDPAENLEAGTRYLKNLIQMFRGDVNLALAAYNAGENAVIRYGHRVPPYEETRNYVYSINMAYRRALAAQAAVENQR